MDLQLARSSRIRTRLSVATITSLGGMAVYGRRSAGLAQRTRPAPSDGNDAHVTGADARLQLYRHKVVLDLGRLRGNRGGVPGRDRLAGLRTLAVIAAMLTLAASGMWIGVVAHHYDTPSLPNVHYASR